jgi:deazaflavin-dependent oxidoreductase (nitroreductase family)
MPAHRDIQALNRSVIEEFRASNGRVTHSRLSSIPLVLLTTTGARTGQARTTPLAYFTDGPGRIFVWASAMAAPSHPAWYHNLAANPQVTIELPGPDQPRDPACRYQLPEVERVPPSCGRIGGSWSAGRGGEDGQVTELLAVGGGVVRRAEVEDVH